MDKYKHLVPVIFVQKSRLQYHVGHILNEFTEITLFRFLMKNLIKNKNRNKKTFIQYHHHTIQKTYVYHHHRKPHLYTPIHTTLTRNTREFTRIIAKTQYNILYYIQSVE